MKASPLRPGLLVAVKTSVTGNAQYERLTLEALHRDAAGQEIERWETRRTVVDPAEHDAAKTTRSKARSIIRSVCADSAFGLLCPEAKREELDAAIAEAQRIADGFNATATLSNFGLYVMVGEIMPDDAKAVRAINSEVRDLMDAMAEGMKNLEPAAIRDAADRARKLGMMLTDSAKERVQVAIETARKAARAIVKAGEQASVTVYAAAIRKITEQRVAFLDLDETPAAEAVAAAPEAARAIDLEPAPEVPLSPAAAAARQFQMEM